MKRKGKKNDGSQSGKLEMKTEREKLKLNKKRQ